VFLRGLFFSDFFAVLSADFIKFSPI